MQQRPQCPYCGSVSVVRDGTKTICLGCKKDGDSEKFLKDTASSNRDFEPDSTSVPMRNPRRDKRSPRGRKKE